MLPDIVLFGLIFVNFFPPIVFPKIYPPISELAHTSNTNIKKISPILLCIANEVAKKINK